ncbi:MAG: hypothetical protein JHC31_13750 [Sulfurihydrogenibium sp.]|nr:hypothetical protein [Sulfurihydrogenibium sp.]
MINQEIYSLIKLYQTILENGNVFDIDSKKLLQLAGDDLYKNSLIISIVSKVIKRKAEIIYQLTVRTEEEKKEETKKIFKEVLKENTQLDDESIEALLSIGLKEKLKKPKSTSPKRITKAEFEEMVKKEMKITLVKAVDYEKEAQRVKAEIEKGTFRIKTLRDFIALMFAIYMFNLEVNSISRFMVRDLSKL